jgi:hypothetical protein
MVDHDDQNRPIGKLFFIFFVFLYILTNVSTIFRYYRRLKATGMARVGSDDKKLLASFGP